MQWQERNLAHREDLTLKNGADSCCDALSYYRHKTNLDIAGYKLVLGFKFWVVVNMVICLDLGILSLLAARGSH